MVRALCALHARALLLTLAPSPSRNQLVLFEDENSKHCGETTCLGKQTNVHQKAFTTLLGAHSCICSESYTDFVT